MVAVPPVLLIGMAILVAYWAGTAVLVETASSLEKVRVRVRVGDRVGVRVRIRVWVRIRVKCLTCAQRD